MFNHLISYYVLRQKKGRKGLRFSTPLNILDAARLVKKCWDSITAQTIESCWVHATWLPHLQIDICANRGLEYKKQVQRQVVHEISSLFSDLSITSREKLISIYPKFKMTVKERPLLIDCWI
jgi:hypothetical protein